MSSDNKATASQLCDAHLIDYMIGVRLAVLDPVYYSVLKTLSNDDGTDYNSIEKPDFTNLDSIYEYYRKIFNRISIRDRKQIEFNRMGDKVVINTNLEQHHLFKVKHLETLFLTYSNEFEGTGQGAIIWKFLVIDNKITVVFDLVDISGFDYDSEENFQDFIQPYIQSLNV